MSETSLPVGEELRESTVAATAGGNESSKQVDLQDGQNPSEEQAAAPVNIPGTSELKAELNRVRQKTRFRSGLRNTFFAIVAVAAAAVLLAMLLMPTLRIYGSSMEPTLKEGNIVVAFKSSEYTDGDIIAFYFNNKVLVKRVIAGPGSWVEISEDGVVTVDGQVLNEPYVKQLALGQCNTTFPYQVPDGRYFVLGDNRETSVDSRSTAIGTVSTDQIIGRVFARVWPLNEFGFIS